MLAKRPPTLEQRENNNKNNKISVAFSVLILFFLYAYCFSNLWEVINIPSPVHFFNDTLGFNIKDIYDTDGNFESNLFINDDYFNSISTIKYKADTEILIYFSLMSLSFLFSYFSPLKYKKIFLVIFAGLIISIVFNLNVFFGLLFMHLLVFSFLHQKMAKKNLISLFIGMLLPLIFIPIELNNIVDILLFSSLFSLIFYFLLEKIIYPILDVKDSKIAYFLRLIVLQSPMITCLIYPFINLANPSFSRVALGILLFFWQWERITMYQIDYNDGAIPENIKLIDYLSIFINPSIIVSLNYGCSIAQGYTYTENSFLAKDKNVLIIEGLKLCSIALFYLILGGYLNEKLSELINEYFGIYSYTMVRDMVLDYSKGTKISTISVLLSTFLAQTKWFMFFGGFVHLRVGLWKIHGYNIEPYFNKPWLATNLANFWVRYTYHYREFLFRVFYYPFFSRFFKKNLTLRVFFATFFTLTVGNFLWGHLSEEMLTYGFVLQNYQLIYRLPYFLLLGLGISLTQIYLLKKKNNKRKPWTKDKMFFLDILCCYLTFQFYSLIHIFARPVPNGNFFMYAKLFLIAFGIHLPR